MDEKKISNTTEGSEVKVEQATQPVVAPKVEVDQKKIKKEKKKKSPKKAKVEKKFKNMRSGGGINLIPELSEQEVRVEGRKISLNLGSAFALLVLVIFSIAVVGYNVISKMSLNTKREQLFALEESSRARSDLIGYNDEILKRVSLYRDIEQSSFSTKNILDYFNAVSNNLGSINVIEFDSGLQFTLNGTASTLTDASKLWHLLANDDQISTVTLKSVIKDGAVVRFVFEGILNFDSFKTL